MLNEIIIVVRAPNTESSGLRIRQKTHKEGFTEYLDISHIFLEKYVNGNLTFATKAVETLKESFEIDIADVPLLINTLKEFVHAEKKKKKLVSVQLVTDMNQYKNEK